MRALRIIAFGAFVVAAFAAPGFVTSPAEAQATCRTKCNDEEQACLKRTGNKSQCGERAKTCSSKCK